MYLGMPQACDHVAALLESRSDILRHYINGSAYLRNDWSSEYLVFTQLFCYLPHLPGSRDLCKIYLTKQSWRQQAYDAEHPDELSKEAQKEELQKQMGKVIKHSNMADETHITDIDSVDHLKEPVLDAETDEDKKAEQDEEKDQVMLLEAPNFSDDRQHNFNSKRITLSMAEIKHIYSEAVEEQEETENATLCSKILKYITLPIEFVTLLLIPNVDKEKINEWYCPLIPFTSAIGVLTITKGIDS